MQTRVLTVDPKTLKLLEVNARFMRHETFHRLTANIKADGVLTQIPFAVPSGDPAEPWWVISGNHRVKAAMAAGLEMIQVQVTDEPLDEQKRKAIQLSHNAISGEDDPATLAQIYGEIDDIDLKEYSGLDDKTLALLAKIVTEPAAAASLDWTIINFTFLPDEAARLKAALEQAQAAVKGVNVVARFKDYDRFMEAVAIAGSSYGVINGATSLLILLDIFDRHVADLRDGFLTADRDPKTKKAVPSVAALGSVEVPPQTASLLAKVLASSEEGTPFEALDQACLAYLGMSEK